MNEETYTPTVAMIPAPPMNPPAMLCHRILTRK
jgi:hypothetical protein